MNNFDPKHWAVILGGSGGFGLATAEKLAKHGMNLCIVHRDRRGAMSKITPRFDALKKYGIGVMTFNLDALEDDGRHEVIHDLEKKLSETGGRVRLLLHSIAFGNLKPLTRYKESISHSTAIRAVASECRIPDERLHQAVNQAFENGAAALHPVSDPPEYGDTLIEKEDFTHTIHAMGSSIVEWVQEIFQSGLFADDARVLSLTSEGNSIAWKGYAAVSAAKAVLESVTRSMAVEFAPYGIRTNVIQAGVTDTPALRMIPGNNRIKAQAKLRNPFGRLTTPEDVARVICLLCTDEAAWINGTLLCADGGERIA